MSPEPTVRYRLSWYVERLSLGVPTTSLLYGDGEFVAADPANVGRVMQCGEVVTQALCREIGQSLRADADGPDLIRGTDPCLIDWRCYGGRDVDWVRQSSEHAQVALELHRPGGGIEWADGRVWDEWVREGQLRPFVEWLSCRAATVVCHPAVRLKPFPWGPGTEFVHVPKANACGALEDVWDKVRHGRTGLFLLCCGLSAIPLAMRLRERHPGVTVLDLGSTLDVFFDLGRERGWRNAIYNDSKALKELKRKNLGGLQ